MIADYIAVDWGSTNVRAWLYLQGECVASQHSPMGVTRLGESTAVEAFEKLIAPWWQHQVPVVMAGMIGSDAGWVSVPYLRCPISLTDISHQLTKIKETPGNVRIIPGICVERDDNMNVMRGEETQLIGAYRETSAEFYLLPGTHSKWVRTDSGVLRDFRTVMTGELHHLLLSNSLIGANLPEQSTDPEAFTQGLEQGFEEPDLVRRLFEVRAARVLGKLAKTSVSDWLSGLLIGHEVAQMKRHYALPSGNGPLVVVGSDNLLQRYLPALHMAGLKSQTVDGDQAFQAGIRSIINDLEN